MLDITMGMDVRDAAKYAAYREAMTPILHSFGGSFVLDVWVNEVLCSPTLQQFNRLFVIRFPSPARMEAFFSDPRYREIRARWFDPAVGKYEELARHES
jgi:uncharacterized protein (DUF1330 family)